MPWNPEKYNQFKEIRYQPFFDLMNLISEKNLKNCVDIGCGTGEQTKILSEKIKDAYFLGIDSSEEMLAQSRKYESDKLQFKLSTIEEFTESESRWDLIFSNAALQWSDHHNKLFPKLISKLNPGGQFAVQMPFQKENILNKILIDMVRENPFADFLGGFVRNSPVLQIDDYARIMFEAGLNGLTLFLKVYPIIADGESNLYDFISGSALIPYMERLDTEKQELFKLEYTKRIMSQFQKFPAIYSFKRILLYGTKSSFI
jgi:trans-aconitate 2-methyltransferase